MGVVLFLSLFYGICTIVHAEGKSIMICFTCRLDAGAKQSYYFFPMAQSSVVVYHCHSHCSF